MSSETISGGKDATDKKLKEFGKRARARFEEERQKRKEIQVLDSSAAILPEKEENVRKRTKSAFNISNVGRKRTTRSSRSSSHTKTSQGRESVVWAPDVSLIPIPGKDSKSPYVKLHGLPIGCTFDNIKRFFTGLNTEKILLLLSSHQEIPAIDASSLKGPPLYIARYLYGNSDMRVLVKFDNVSAAELAVDRSGESIFSNQLIQFQHTTEGDEETISPPNAFAICVTQLSKEMADSLLNLSVNARPGAPFHSQLSSVQSALPNLVREILWSNAQRDCGVAVDSETQRASLLLSNDGTHYDEANDPMSLAGYQKYANHYNRLLQLQEDLLLNVQDLSGEALVSANPLIRLTAQACKVIDGEMDRINEILYQVRVARRTNQGQISV
jgi:hypothetical protein